MHFRVWNPKYMKIKKLIFLDISQQLMCYKGTQHKETEFSGFYRNYMWSDKEKKLCLFCLSNCESYKKMHTTVM